MTKRQKQEAIAIRAIKTFGAKEQREMLVEECSELIMAVQKVKRVEKNGDLVNLKSREDNLVEEMVDVCIMIMQFYLTDNKLKSKFDEYFDGKLTRLDKRVTDFIEKEKFLKDISNNKIPTFFEKKAVKNDWTKTKVKSKAKAHKKPIIKKAKTTVKKK